MNKFIWILIVFLGFNLSSQNTTLFVKKKSSTPRVTTITLVDNDEGITPCVASAFDYTAFNTIDLSAYGGSSLTGVSSDADVITAFSDLGITVTITNCDIDIASGWAGPFPDVEVINFLFSFYVSINSTQEILEIDQDDNQTLQFSSPNIWKSLAYDCTGGIWYYATTTGDFYSYNGTTETLILAASGLSAEGMVYDDTNNEILSPIPTGWEIYNTSGVLQSTVTSTGVPAGFTPFIGDLTTDGTRIWVTYTSPGPLVHIVEFNSSGAYQNHITPITSIPTNGLTYDATSGYIFIYSTGNGVYSVDLVNEFITLLIPSTLLSGGDAAGCN